MKVFVIRHGLTELNKLGKFNGQAIDEPLAPEGREQAKEIREQLPEGIEVLYSSDLKRAHETALILNERLRVPLDLLPQLREVNAGGFNGLSHEEMNAKAGKNIFAEYRAQQYDFRPWGGESVLQVQTRIREAMEQIKSESSNKKVLVVAHGGIIRAMHYLYKDDVLSGIQNLSIHEFEV